MGVVVPVWNDADVLARTLSLLLREWKPSAICVVDGGSRDDSVAVARSHGATVIRATTRSRARQMNQGAGLCRAEVVLFLHADTHLPCGARESIARAVEGGAVGGAFARRFDHPSLFLRLTCLTADWRGKWFGMFLGDQAIFATREAFEKAGGFPDQPLFEDFEFSRRLAKAGRTVLLRPPVISSGRRFERKGPLRQTMADLALTIRYARRGPEAFAKEKRI